MRGPILHVLSQRPGQTGSGVILEALVEQAAAAGWEQLALVGLPAGLPAPELSGTPLRPLRFGTERLPFDLPGMSDTMPYPSRRFASLSTAELAAYRAAWREHLAAAVAELRPRVIHSHHVWLLSALIKDVAPEIPVLTSCHATGLRQAELCPGLAPSVRRGCARNERFLALHAGHAARLAEALEVAAERIDVAGAGYRPEHFHARGRTAGSGRLLYVGKFAAAKGLPQLLDASERLAAGGVAHTLDVAGGGGGEEGATLEARMAALAPRVTLHGQLEQPELAALMRRCDVCVLPSFFEGLPLVLVEAAACGCRLVATDLPGIRAELAARLGDVLALVPPPALIAVDRPHVEELPGFTARLSAALGAALEAGEAPAGAAAACRDLAWPEVFARVERIWLELASRGAA